MINEHINKLIENIDRNNGVFFELELHADLPFENQVAEFIREEYQKLGYKDVEILDNPDVKYIKAVYCVLKGYEFITYCSAFVAKDYEFIPKSKNLKEVVVISCAMPEIQDFFYVKSNWLTRLLHISSDEKDNLIVEKEFSTNLEIITKN